MSLAQDRVVSTELRGGQLARLEQQLKEWMAECAQIEHRNPLRARNLADAIRDLRILLERVQSVSLPDAPNLAEGDPCLSQADGNAGVCPDRP